ncbi:unnamed protein product [Arctia plantaginis]|uniref:Uncharacterized protein n=1 Tax=Arctia plantaginis TaxID=874455 RepID=A0A8S0ZND7_ARCPL|nr:unnamed protein product [Arctia plantaginis]
MPTSLNNSLFKDYEIHKRAWNNESVNVKKRNRSDNNAIESEINIILNQILNFIETRYNNTKDTKARASLSSNPEAWIKLVLELSKALKEIAVRANESYYMLIQQPTPSFVIKTWRKSFRNRPEDERLDGFVGVLSEVTANEISEDLDRKNEIFMNEEFPLKLNLRQNVENLMDQDIEEDNHRYVYMDTESGDIVSDGIEEVRISFSCTMFRCTFLILHLTMFIWIQDCAVSSPELPNHAIEMQIEFFDQDPSLSPTPVPQRRTLRESSRHPKKKDQKVGGHLNDPSKVSETTLDPRKRPVYMDDLNKALSDLEKKLLKNTSPATTNTPCSGFTKSSSTPKHGVSRIGTVRNIGDILQLLKKAVQVEKHLPQAHDENLDWVQIKIPKDMK